MSDPTPTPTTDAPIRLSAAPPPGEASIEGGFVLSLAGERTAFALEVPAGSTDLEILLPVFQGLADAVVARGESRAQGEGAHVSCRAGCGACCRQAVPVAEPEARALAALVEAMPEPRRSAVRARFAAAEQRLAEGDLTEKMADLASADDAEVIEAGLAYFRLGLTCPFLEAEACSIHPDRPLICREYLVTSPAVRCADPKAGDVERVKLPGRPSRALFSIGRSQTQDGWVLLIQALSFAERHPEPPPRRSAREWIEAVVGRMAGDPNAR